jgi:(p)ppGpp synthase/HD superfamily hydrolase
MASLETIVAHSIAQEVHSKQKDFAGYSTMNHIYGVSRAVKSLGEDYVVVALLHDTLEDAGSELRPKIEEHIKNTFNKKVIDAVYAITHNADEDYFADVKNNLSRLGNIEEKELRNKLETKYKKALEVLGES